MQIVNPVPDPEADARILEVLRIHDERERAILESYRRLVDDTTDDGIRYLGASSSMTRNATTK